MNPPLSADLRQEMARRLAPFLTALRGQMLDAASAAGQKALGWAESQLDDSLLRGRFLFQLSELFFKAGLNKEADPYFAAAIDAASTDRQPIARRLEGVCHLGKVAFDRQDFAAAEQGQAAALILTCSLDDPELLESQLGDLGNVLRGRGRYPEAEACYREALELARQRDDRRGQHLALERGTIGQALAWLEESYQITRTLGEPLEIVADLLHLSRVYSLLNNQAEVRRCVEAAQAVCKEAGLPLTHSILTALGQLAREIGDMDGAAAAYRAALAGTEAERDKLNLGADWLNLGIVAFQRRDWAEAERCFAQSAALHRVAGNVSGLVSALAIAKSVGLPDDIRHAWHNLASLHWQQGEQTAAIHAQKEAVQWAEWLRGSILPGQERIGYWSTVDDSYHNLLQMHLAAGQTRLAWETLERMRSRSLAELLGVAPLSPHMYQL